MKIVRINIDGTMNDLEISSSKKKTITSKLNKLAISKGDTSLKELYKWVLDSSLEILCYGYYDGGHGFENKHDLPPNGISDFLDEEDDSATKLLFGDIFIVLYNTKKKIFFDCSVSDYGRYYGEIFEGFDECNTSEEESINDEINTDDEDFIVDDNHIEDIDDESAYSADNDSIEQLDNDENTYSEEDSDYDEACEGETDEEDEEDEEDEGNEEDENGKSTKKKSSE